MGKFSRIGNELYGGRRSIDFVERRGLWYAVSGLLVGAAIVIVIVKGLNFGVEFTGGTQYRVPVPADQVTQTTADEVREIVASEAVPNAESPVVSTAGGSILVQVGEITQEQSDQITQAISDGVETTGEISQDEISASWGSEVAERAVIGVGVFLLLVMIFIGTYFREWKMSVASFVALFHDVAITVGIYALSGFQVTPSAVTGLLAILGFSLYDTVVVFDKIRENTAEMRKTRLSYAQAANLAVNQTLVRSINTGIVALIPIGAILFVSAAQLGASSLQDLALSQFVGMAVGVYSSVVLAPRVLVHMKSGERAVRDEERRAAARERNRAADPYATVPARDVDDRLARKEAEEAEFLASLEDEDDDHDHGDDHGDDGEGRQTAGAGRSEARGKGRVAPPAHGPVGHTNAAGRTQPSRKPRSQRGKK